MNPISLYYVVVWVNFNYEDWQHSAGHFHPTAVLDSPYKEIRTLFQLRKRNLTVFCLWAGCPSYPAHSSRPFPDYTLALPEPLISYIAVTFVNFVFTNPNTGANITRCSTASYCSSRTSALTVGEWHWPLRTSSPEHILSLRLWLKYRNSVF